MGILLTANTTQGDIHRPDECTLRPIENFVTLTKMSLPNLGNKMVTRK